MMDNSKAAGIRDKKEVGPMFDSIAWRYDFLNHLLSFGVDRRWRRKAIRKIPEEINNPLIIDVATGTGDFALEALSISPSKITGIDISEKMLELARRKVKTMGFEGAVEFIRCNSENICFNDDTFDVAIVAFGVRNFTDPLKGLSEMWRVIRYGGIAIILEFSKPDGYFFRHVYNFYFRHLLPFIGSVFSGNRKAYRYLNESVMDFADNEAFVAMMRGAGFSDVSQTRLSMGIATIYTGVKKKIQ